MDWHQDPSQLMLFDAHAHAHISPEGFSSCLSSYSADKTLIVFIGGAMDDVYRPLLNGVFIPYRLKHSEHQDSCYATHAATKQVLGLIKHWHAAGQKICLVGHSWGGRSVIQIAQNLLAGTQITIELMITLDPVSRRYLRRQFRKPNNVKRWINVHIDYGKASREYSNMVARLGGYWAHCLYADQNIKLSHDNGEEITHAMAGRMFVEVEDQIISL